MCVQIGNIYCYEPAVTYLSSLKMVICDDPFQQYKQTNNGSIGWISGRSGSEVPALVTARHIIMYLTLELSLLPHDNPTSGGPGYGFCQWSTMLQYNVVSHWLSVNPEYTFVIISSSGIPCTRPGNRLSPSRPMKSLIPQVSTPYKRKNKYRSAMYIAGINLWWMTM